MFRLLTLQITHYQKPEGLVGLVFFMVLIGLRLSIIRACGPVDAVFILWATYYKLSNTN